VLGSWSWRVTVYGYDERAEIVTVLTMQDAPLADVDVTGAAITARFAPLSSSARMASSPM
jgi:hypothetical protein